MAIVWACQLPVGAYVAAGGQVEFPRPDCPSCGGPLVFWSGYRRYVRVAGRCTGCGSPSGPSAPSCAAPGCTARPWPRSRGPSAGMRPAARTSGGSPTC